MKFILFIALTFVFACESSKTDEIVGLKSNVSNIHDEVMVKTNVLIRARKDMLHEAQYLSENDSLNSKVLLLACYRIDSISSVMTSWMQGIAYDFEGTSDEKLAYFKKQRETIINLKIEVENSLSSEILRNKKQALDTHDIVMPKMGELRRARKYLMLQADSLVESDSIRAQIFMSASDEIELANESMMNWMRNFELDFEGTEEEQLEYFKKKKTSIEEVEKAMNESLAKGKEVLEGN